MRININYQCNNTKRLPSGDIQVMSTWADRTAAVLIFVMAVTGARQLFDLAPWLGLVALLAGFPVLMLAPPRRFVSFSPKGELAEVFHTGIARQADFSVPAGSLKLAKGSRGPSTNGYSLLAERDGRVRQLMRIGDEGLAKELQALLAKHRATDGALPAAPGGKGDGPVAGRSKAKPSARRRPATRRSKQGKR